MILAIDPSTSATGWAVFNGDQLVEHGEIKSTAAWCLGRKISKMIDGIETVMANHQIDAIVCESQFINPSRPSAAIPVAGVTGAIEMSAYRWNKPFTSLAPATIKKVFAGHGRAKKEVVIAKVKEVFGIQGISDNTADAIAIGYTYIKEAQQGGNI